jgi:primosomal protein N' (replication factor Y)
VKEAFRLLDEDPVLEEHLISLGRWIASYYCAPIGEVLRVMTPLGGEIRSTKMYSLTDAGRDAARQLLFGADTEDPAIQILRLLERRSLSASYLAKKVADAPKALRSLL